MKEDTRSIVSSQGFSNQPVTINYVNFNQTGSCISVGTNKGVSIFNCEPFGKFYSGCDDTSSYGIVEMVYNTALLACVGLGEQISLSARKLKLINTRKKKTIVEFTFHSAILSIKMSKSRMVILLKSQIYIYDITTMKLLHIIETSDNPLGIIDISQVIDSKEMPQILCYSSPQKVISSEISNHLTTNNITLLNNIGNNHHMAMPKLQEIPGDDNNDFEIQGPNNPTTNLQGDIVVFNLVNLQPTHVINAHKAPISTFKLNAKGTLLASASTKGTIVRVFDITKGVKKYQFRRGTYNTKILCLDFDKTDQFLLCCSSSLTVHIFKMMDNNGFQPLHSNDKTSTDNNGTNNNGGETEAEPVVDSSRLTVGRIIRKSSQNAMKKIGNALNLKMTGLEPSRHFASLKIPVTKNNNSANTSNLNFVGGDDDINSIKTGTSSHSNFDSSGGNIFSNGNELGIRATFGELVKINVEDYPELSNKQTNTVDFEHLGSSPNETLHSESNGSVRLMTVLPVYVVTTQGGFYKYFLDPVNGGDCILIEEFELQI
ncbi:hypothetical protein QEN19_003329 [Hanseniaspora menglaensis]